MLAVDFDNMIGNRFDPISHTHFIVMLLINLVVQMALVHRPVRGVCFVGHDRCKLQLYALHNCV